MGEVAPPSSRFSNMQSPPPGMRNVPRTPMPANRPRASSGPGLRGAAGLLPSPIQRMPHRPAGPAVAKGRRPKLPRTDLIHIAMDMLKAGHTPAEVENAWEKIGYVASKRTRQYYISDIQNALIANGLLTRDGIAETVNGTPSSSAPRKNDIVYCYVMQYLSGSATDSISPTTDRTLESVPRSLHPTSLPLDLGRRMADDAVTMDFGTSYITQHHPRPMGLHHDEQITSRMVSHETSAIHQTLQSFRNRQQHLAVLGEDEVVNESAPSEFDQDDVFMMGFEPDPLTGTSHQYSSNSPWNSGVVSSPANNAIAPWTTALGQYGSSTPSYMAQHHRSFSQVSYASNETGPNSLNSYDEHDDQAWDIPMASLGTEADVGFSFGTSISSQPSRYDLSSPHTLPRSVAPVQPSSLHSHHAGRTERAEPPRYGSQANDPANVGPIPIRKSTLSNHDHLQGQILPFGRQPTSALHKQLTKTESGEGRVYLSSSSSHDSRFPAGVGKYAQSHFDQASMDDPNEAFDWCFPIEPSPADVNLPAYQAHDVPHERWQMVDRRQPTDAPVSHDMEVDLDASFTEENSRSMSTMHTSVLTAKLRESRESINVPVAPTPGPKHHDIATGNEYSGLAIDRAAHGHSIQTPAQPRRNLTAHEKEQFFSMWDANQFEVVNLFQHLQGL